MIVYQNVEMSFDDLGVLTFREPACLHTLSFTWYPEYPFRPFVEESSRRSLRAFAGEK